MRLGLVLLAAVSTVPSAFAGDFNGDGFDDLIVAAMGASVFQAGDGAYYVLLGSANGIDGTSGVEKGLYSPDPSPMVADKLAVGDFDGDGLADVAISMAGATIDTVIGAGKVQIRYGTTNGFIFDGSRDIYLHQNVPGVVGEAGQNPAPIEAEAFGIEIAVGDFDGNKCDDLAVTVLDMVNQQPHAGAVHVFYGKKKVGLTAKKSQYWTQDSKGIASTALESENFGERLCVGDFNGDHRDDLVVLSKNHDEPTTRAALQILFGSKRGLTAKKSLTIDDVALGLPQPSTPWLKFFAAGLAAGDFNGDGRDELVVGVPGEPIAAMQDGTFHLLPGTKKGPDVKQQLVYSQATPGVPGVAEGDLFGSAFAVGDFDGNDIDDLAIGIPRNADQGVQDAGAVAVLYGNPIGLIGAGAEFLHQNILAFGQVEQDDLFGLALAVGDFDGDGVADLAVAAPGEDVAGFNGCGMVDLFYGAAGIGFPTAPVEHHYRGDGEIPGPAADGELFGSSLGS